LEYIIGPKTYSEYKYLDMNICIFGENRIDCEDDGKSDGTNKIPFKFEIAKISNIRNFYTGKLV
jgi:hypothetical protein